MQRVGRFRTLMGAIAAILLCPAVGAAQCMVSVTGLAFGTYDVFSASPTDSAGTITVECAAGTGYSVALSPGVSGSYVSRTMIDGGRSLQYGLYLDSARSVSWGDGSGGSATVSGTGSGAQIHHTVYGRIPARQNARVGSYADSITVTVAF